MLVTLPLAVLQSDCVRFEPQLPEDKVKAIASLGVGKVEKVAVKIIIMIIKAIYSVLLAMITSH